MSTTGEAADVDGSGQPSTSDLAALSISSQPDMMRCTECYPERTTPAKSYCLYCKLSSCTKCDTEIVHNSKTTRNHPRMPIKEYLMVERSLGHSLPTDDDMFADDENKFCFFSQFDHRIHLTPRLASLVVDPDAQPSLAAFIGPTGVGKSTLLPLLISIDGETDAGHMPVAGAPKDTLSTSADIHMYPGGQVSTQVQSAVDSTYPLVYVDSEGSGGLKEPRGVHNFWHTAAKAWNLEGVAYNNFKDKRFKRVQLSYPRILYIFADVLCFVFSGDWRERASIMGPLLQWGEGAAAGAANQHRPQLILIFNKMGQQATDPEFDSFRKTFYTWIGEDNESRRGLLRFYSEPLVCLIPHMAIDAKVFLHRVSTLREEIRDCTTRIRGFREKANQLFTRRQLQLHMQLATDTFNKDPNAKFDIYTASMARRPPSGKLSDYIVDFRRAVEQANSQCTSKSERYETSLSIVRGRIELSVLLWNARLNVNMLVGRRGELPGDLESALKEAQTVIEGEQPCAAQLESGRLSCHCDTVKHMHADAPHVSVRNGKAVRWDGEFISHRGIQYAIKGFNLINLAEGALSNVSKLDKEPIRTRLSEVRESERRKYQ